MYRRRAVVRDRRARPMPELTIGDSGGRLCYVVIATGPHAIAVSLEADQVDVVLAALTAWRTDRDADLQPFARLSSAAQTAV